MRVVEIAAASMLSLAVGQAHAASEQDWAACAGKDLATAIQACSRIVSDQATTLSDRADGYLFRAGAYLSQRNFDLAIADYTEAIRLAPRNVTAYAGRALAYFKKGNRDQAAADFSIVNKLDSAKAAELAATDPALNEIAALARSRAPAPSSVSEPIRRPLPPDVGLSEEVVHLLETDPLFAQSPPVRVRAWNTEGSSWSETDGPAGRMTMTMTAQTQYRLEALGGGLVKFDSGTNSEGKTKVPGSPLSHSVLRRAGVTVGNGFFELNSTFSFQNFKPVETKLLRIEKMSGRMFPMQINNHFSFAAAYKTTGVKGEDEFSWESDCVISQEFEAKSLHPDLTGRAFIGVCENFRVYKIDKSLNSTSRGGSTFIEDLGYVINASPIGTKSNSPASPGDATTAGVITYRGGGTTVLKSFTLRQ